MELNQENIEKVAEVLRMGEFNKAMKDVQDYFEIAKTLIEQYPDLTAEEIGQIYETQCMEQVNNKEQNNDGPTLEE